VQKRQHRLSRGEVPLHVKQEGLQTVTVNQSDLRTSFLAVKSGLKYDLRDALAVNQARPRGSGLPNKGGGLIEIGLA
jgi:hypothetical protein